MPAKQGMENTRDTFWSRVKKIDSGCWLWLGNQNYYGYGRFNFIGDLVMAHRFAYEDVKGKIPDGLVIDHLCRNPICVNPAHLEAVTHSTNTLRGISSPTQNKRKTHCPRGHELIESNCVKAQLKRGQRYCKVCKSEHDKRYKQSKKNTTCFTLPLTSTSTDANYTWTVTST